MITNQHTLKIQVPAMRPAPPNAARIGEFAADLLALAQATAKAAGRALRGIRPSAVRDELRDTATQVEGQRPAVTLSLRTVAAKGWIY